MTAATHDDPTRTGTAERQEDNVNGAHKGNGRSFKIRVPVDLGNYLDTTVYPALFLRLDSAFPEFNWKKHGDAWEATTWPPDFPEPANDKRGDRLMVYPDRPWWIKVHGHSGVRFLDYVNGGRKPIGPEFPEGVRKLCQAAGVPFLDREQTKEQVEQAHKREARRAVLEDTIAFCQEVLWSEQGEQARAYLRDGRGLTDDQIRTFRLGLYLEASALRQFLKDRGHNQAVVKESAVLWRCLEGYDIVPWHDEHGQPRTLYGRWREKTPPLMKDLSAWKTRRKELWDAWKKAGDGTAWQEPRVPKTVALPGEGTKAVPFCFDLARRAGREFVLFEGLIDALYMQAQGETRAVASVAAQLNGEQVKLLARYKADRVFVCGDPDGGGDRGTLANLKALSAAGITAYVAPRLPDGQDVDEFVRQRGIDAWHDLVKKAVHSFRFMARQVVAEVEARRGPYEPGDDGWNDAVVEAAVKFATGQPPERRDELRRHFWDEIEKATGARWEDLQERMHPSDPTSNNHNPGRPAETPPRSPPAPESYEPFPIDALPGPLAEYVRQGADALRCDPAYIALSVLAVAASAIGNSRVIRLKDDWEEPSIVWTAFVGDSGTLKTPAYKKAVAHLWRRQKQLIEEHKKKAAAYLEELLKWKAAKKKAEAEEGADPGDKPEEPTLQRIICSDITIEKLAEILEDNPRGILVARDELAAWLGSFSRYKGKAGGTDLPNWLEMHQAGTISYDRKTGDRRLILVSLASASVGGGIQPGVLVRALTPEFLEAGLGARLLLAMPPKVRKHWTKKKIAAHTRQAYEDTIDRLLALTIQRDGECQVVPHVLSLSPEAMAVWVEFYERWAQEEVDVDGELAFAYAKLEAYAARFALLYHVVTCVAAGDDDLLSPVCPESVKAGAILCRWFAREARRIYRTLTEDDEDRQVRRLLELLRSWGGRATASRLRQSNDARYPTIEAAEAALQLLVDAGLAVWEDKPPTKQGGRPTRECVLCPQEHASETSETPETQEAEAAMPEGG
jgi:DNA primase